MKTRTSYAFGFAVAGFGIGAVTCAYTFHLTSHSYKGGPPNLTLYLILCPPSIGSMALDNAGILGGLIGWFFISLENAVLYVLVGLGIGTKLERKSN